MNNKIADIFDEIALILELNDDNQFKISAYKNSARIIRGLTQDLGQLLNSGELEKIKGFGKATIEKIKEILSTGHSPYLSELKSTIPVGLFELFRVKGLGPKKVRMLWKKLNITNLGELEYACTENRLVGLEGFGEKTQGKILEGIDFLKRAKGKFLIDSATDTLLYVSDILKKDRNIEEISPVGEARRGAEVYSSIQLLIVTQDVLKTLNNLSKFDFTNITHNPESNLIEFISPIGLKVEIFYCEKNQFPEKIHFLTGSLKYLDNLNSYLINTEYQIKDNLFYKGTQKLICKNESDIFNFLKMEFIPPELREGNDEIELAIKNKIPKLIESNDIKGALHVHTNYSDGLYSLEEMVKEAQKIGFEYIGFCDHSKTAAYANGLKEEDINKQMKEIDSLNKKYDKIKILKGIESDILPSGDLDYPDDILDKFDFIVASIHSNFTLSEEEMTKRIIRAVENKYITILGHPSGRLLLSRESYKIDLNKIIDACKANNVAIELNSDEHRLDLGWEIIKNAIPKGLKISINTDAHHIQSLKKIKYGIMMARKAFVTKKNVINALSHSEFINYLSKKKITTKSP